MGDNSAIEWTTHTFNPWWGCAHVSPGCVNCYAEAWAKRMGHDVFHKGGERRLFGDAHWAQPARWNARAAKVGRPARVFCASMADVFEDHPDVAESRERLWRTIEATPMLHWQLLTKRPENIRAMVPEGWRDWPMPNVWLGTSVEDQQRADERVNMLLSVPAAVHFLSCEPLVGPVELDRVKAYNAALHGDPGDMGTIDWVIVGGESGPRSRPMDIEWAARIVSWCKEARVPVFVKQLGSKPIGCRVSDAKGGKPDEWPGALRVREFPVVAS